MKNYLINRNTFMIIPYKENKSKIIENYTIKIIELKPIDIIDYSCKVYGSSFQGRCDSTTFLTGIKYKCPILISEIKNIIMFPTTSSKNDACIWINYESISNFTSIDQENVEILLKNNKKIKLNISSRIISNQFFKSSRLDSIMKSKK